MEHKMLHIGKPYIEDVPKKNSVRLCVKINVPDKDDYILWYETDEKYRKYLCTERSDAFVVNLLLYAMEHQLDIECAQCVTERLYYQLTEYLIPSISKNIDRYSPITVSASLDASVLPTANAVGASLSGGVDSFYTLLHHIDRKESSFNITHLTFFNAGASGEFGGEEARTRYKERIEWIRDVADELSAEMICVDTNANEFLHQNHEATHTFRTLAIPLLLQKLFGRYYFSSGFSFRDFEFDKIDTAHYDLLNVECLSTDALTFYSSGGEATRLEKLEYISGFPITYNRLNVCVSEAVSCSRCEKCRRTMVGLYAIGKLHLYEKVFDVKYFEQHKHEYVSDAIKYLKSLDWPETYQKLKAEHKINGIDYCIGVPKLIWHEVKKSMSKNSLLRSIYHEFK